MTEKAWLQALFKPVDQFFDLQKCAAIALATQCKVAYAGSVLRDASHEQPRKRSWSQVFFDAA